MSADVLKHFGAERPADGYYSDRVLYSDRDFPANAESVAKEYFGTTLKWAETGWLLQDGTQLDFSGRHWERDPDNEIDLGEGFYSGHRNVEHYEIAEAFPELRELSKMEYRGEHLDKFLKRGNIRVVGAGMLDIETMPTEAQIEKLRGYFRENIDKYIVIGIGAGGLEFREGTKPATIIEAIRDYFSNNRGSQSELMQFHTRYSERDSDGHQLSKEQREFFNDSKVRDADGNLMVMYHGTANGGAFTVFDGDKLGNETRTTQMGQGFYFTNVKKEAEAYTKNVDIYGRASAGSSPHLHRVYLNITNPFNVTTDTIDIGAAKSVYMDGTYADYYEVRVPAAPTAYIECEFHDTVEGAKWIVENTVLIGETIARGICDYFGVKFVEKPKPVEPEKKDVLYRVQIGAYKIKANAEKRQAEAKAAGFTDAFIVTVEQ